MPGPFPGMDPYLEDPVLWHGVHTGLIFCLAEEMNRILPPGYVARIEERIYLAGTEHFYPDVALFHRSPKTPQPASGGGAAVADSEDAPEVMSLYPDEVHERYIEIKRVKGEKRVVTVIEVLSPGNKASGSEGRKEYLRKQEQILHSDTNFLEIDLLRRGTHTVSAPQDPLRECGSWDYLICLHRSAQLHTIACWRISVRQRLPRIRVPLAEGDPDILLDVQAAFDRCYDAGRYSEEADYRTEPDPPLEGDDKTWADALLREKGLRT